MKRIGIASLVGGVVLFIWVIISWGFVPWHRPATLPDQGAVTSVLADTATESGIYQFPGRVESTDEEHAEAADGPESAGWLMYKSGGGMPVWIQFVVGFVLEVLVAAVIAGLLTMAAPALPGFASRLGFVMLIGVLMVVGTNLMNWNWMHFPFRFTLEAAADTLVASLLLGIVLAIIVKPYSEISDIDDVSGVEATPDT
jgi:hypothetical protein